MIAAPAAGIVATPSRRRLLAFEARSMGSPLRLSIVLPAVSQAVPDHAADAWQLVRDEFAACDDAMSRFRESSEITLLNRHAGRTVSMAVSPRLRRALTTSDRAHRVTGGRFDPRVLGDLERLGDRGAALHAGSSETRSRRPTGRVVVAAGDRRLHLDDPVDLGGIGKGLALRWAAAAIARHGFDGFLVDAGGDLVMQGKAHDGELWRVGIEDPTGTLEPLAIIGVRAGAVATSSVRRRRWTSDDRVVHHLIDPSTGEPGGEGLLAVTVAGADPAWAEIWSKALFLAGSRGVATLARGRGLAAWWVTESGALEMTPAGRAATLWVAAEAS